MATIAHKATIYSKRIIANKQFAEIQQSPPYLNLEINDDPSVVTNGIITTPHTLSEDVTLYRQSCSVRNCSITVGLQSSGILRLADIVLIEYDERIDDIIVTQTFKRVDGSVNGDDTFISIEPVSTAQFMKYCRDASCTTSAEVYRAEFTFRRRPGDSELSVNEVSSSPASYIDFADAMNYCRWAGLDLPTEQEWLHASILDASVLDDVNNYVASHASKRRLRQSLFALRRVGCEIVLTNQRDSFLVLCGPHIIVTSSDSKRNVNTSHP